MIAKRLAGTAGKCAAVASVATVSALAFAGTAGAAAPVVNAITTQGTVAANSPFISGQTLTISLPNGTITSSGATFPQHENIFIAECSAPNGVQPTLTSECDAANTGYPASVQANASGGFSINNFSVFALPDPGLSVSQITCGDTAATECDLYIGLDTSDFTAAHVFSQPFYASVGDGQDDGVGAGDGTGSGPGVSTPEIPLAIGLPLAAGGIFGAVFYRRRRAAARTAAQSAV